MKSGEVLGGRYEIQDLAGVGGMGEVHRAVDRERRCPVAVKLVYRRSAGDLARFEREARVLASLDLPSIVKYVGEARDEAGGYLVMAWLEGESHAARRARSRLTLAESFALCDRLAQGLAHAHAHGVVHRDLKPSNVLLVDGALEGAKIIDFGLARVDDDGGVPITASHATLGTPGYMAPEQARRPRDVDARADVYSLGCVLFRCATSRGGRRSDGQKRARGARRLRPRATRRGSARSSTACPRASTISSRACSPRDPNARPADVAGELAIADAAISLAAARLPRGPRCDPTTRFDASVARDARGRVAGAGRGARVAADADAAARARRSARQHQEDTTPRPTAESTPTNAAPSPSGSGHDTVRVCVRGAARAHASGDGGAAHDPRRARHPRRVRVGLPLLHVHRAAGPPGRARRQRTRGKAPRHGEGRARAQTRLDALIDDGVAWGGRGCAYLRPCRHSRR